MNGYTIEYVYFIFPIVCILINNIKMSSRLKTIALFVLFIIIYSLSLNGSDYHSYENIYKNFEDSYIQTQVETGFLVICQLFFRLGIDYTGFRIIYLLAVSAVLFYSVYKISPKPAFSLCLISCMFLIYLISTYRQYMVMAFTMYSCLEYSKGRIRKAFIILILMAFIHICALEPLLFMLLYHFGREDISTRFNPDITRLGFGLLISSYIIRIVLVVLLNVSAVKALVDSIIRGRVGTTPTPLSFGLLSRSVILILIIYLYYLVKPKDRLLNILYWMYLTGMFFYIMIPLELLMGRLMNTVNTLSTLLIPMLLCYKADEKDQSADGILYEKGIVRGWIVSKGIIVIAIVMLFFQLTNQNGYTPYYNILKGDTFKTVKFQELKKAETQ